MLRSVNFQIRIWSIINIKSEENQKMALVAECYLFVHELLSMKSNTTNVNGQYFKKINLEKILWHDGKDVGKLNADIFVKHEPYIQQLFAGVMTEKGLKRAAPLVIGEGKKMDKSPHYLELNLLLHRLNQLNLDYEFHSFDQKQAGLDYESFKNKDTIDKIKKVLSQTQKQISISFVYPNVEEMMKIQEKIDSNVQSD